MNADVEELLKDDAEARRLVESLRHAPVAHVSADFSARVLAEVREQRRCAWLSASSVFAAAASIVALIAIGSIFFRPVPKPSLSTWVERPFTVRLAPYNPAEWYSPFAFEEQHSAQNTSSEPFCTLEALASYGKNKVLCHGEL